MTALLGEGIEKEAWDKSRLFTAFLLAIFLINEQDRIAKAKNKTISANPLLDVVFFRMTLTAYDA